jgi:hypothetical protein
MRTIVTSVAAACLLVTAPHAQEANRAQQPPPEPAHNTIVLAGCLAAGSDESIFKLTNATPNAQASASQPQAVGTSGDRAVYEIRAEKNLDQPAVAPIDLKQFVGRQIEVTARISDEPASTEPARAAGEAKVDADPAKPVEKKNRPLTVTAVKQLLPACQ